MFRSILFSTLLQYMLMLFMLCLSNKVSHLHSQLSFLLMYMYLYSTSKVTATIEPEGKRCAIDVRGVVEPPTAIPKHVSSSSGAPPPPLIAGSKLRLKCAPQVLKFAGVELNERK